MNRKMFALPRVCVHNLQRKIRVDVVALQEFAERAVELCRRVPRKTKTDLNQLREVFILIVSDRKIAALHRKFMQEAGPTDVITFQHGEIFISAETAKRQARQFGTILERELRLYLVHGLLHLHGFDDRNAAGRRKMAAFQERILARAGV